MGNATLNDRKFPYLMPITANPKEKKLFNSQSLVDM